MHELSLISAFIEKHGKKDSRKNKTTHKEMLTLQRDLIKHMKILQKELTNCKIK
jgi:hypothetical protein